MSPDLGVEGQILGGPVDDDGALVLSFSLLPFEAPRALLSLEFRSRAIRDLPRIGRPVEVESPSAEPLGIVGELPRILSVGRSRPDLPLFSGACHVRDRFAVRARKRIGPSKSNSARSFRSRRRAHGPRIFPDARPPGSRTRAGGNPPSNVGEMLSDEKYAFMSPVLKERTMSGVTGVRAEEVPAAFAGGGAPSIAEQAEQASRNRQPIRAPHRYLPIHSGNEGHEFFSFKAQAQARARVTSDGRPPTARPGSSDPARSRA